MTHPNDEWLIAENENGRRQYLIHTTAPRFWCRLCDDDEDYPMSGLTAELDNGQTLADFTWFDQPPVDDAVLLSLFREASDAIDLYDRRLDRDMDHLADDDDEF